MDDLEREILLKRVELLKKKLDLAVQQRDGFMTNYHAIMRVPFSERYEIVEDCNRDLDKLNG